jgi:tetratricopeptide (TPR) repeat protein
MHDDRRAAWACVMLDLAHIFLGNFPEAPPLRERARRVFERVGDFRGIAWVSAMWGCELEYQRDFENAMGHYKALIQMGRESGGFQHETSWALARLAECCLRLGHLNEAMDYAHQCLDIALRISNKLEYGAAYKVLAELHVFDEYRDWSRAARYLDESLKAFRDVGAELDVGRTYLAAARIARLKGDDNVRELAGAARDIAHATKSRPLQEEAEALLAGLPR